jgi:hypothetical protein
VEGDLQVTLLPDLFEFAYVPNWFDHLSSLAEMAMPESWRFTHPILPPKNTDTPILEKFVNYVFRKQIIDFNNFNYMSDPEFADRIFYVRNEKACFNTGLYTKSYKSIYGCFTRNKRKDAMQDWFFRGFFDDVAPDMKYVQPLPDKPGLLVPITGMTYFPVWDIRVNVNHILCDPDNFARLPLEVQRAKNLSLLLETAVELARRKASFEPGIVVPQGYQGKVQFLLPLCLLDTEHTDLTMTLTPMDGYYLGHTCLTLEMAYLNARLIGRPIAPWLLELVT